MELMHGGGSHMERANPMLTRRDQSQRFDREINGTLAYHWE